MKSSFTDKLFVIQFPNRRITACLFVFIIFFTGIQERIYAQDGGAFTNSAWWFGGAGGINYNLYHGSFQELNSNVNFPVSFQNTKGTGQFAFPVAEYHPQGTKLGFMLYSGYESRRGSFNNELSTKLAYITFEPSVRLNLFNSPFYLYSGPRLAFNVDKRFSGGLISNMRKSIFSMQIGGGYDISLTAEDSKNQVILSPFVAFHPYFGQNPRSIESWNLTTLRVGIALKFGRGHKVVIPEKIVVPVVIDIVPDDKLLATAPQNIQDENKIIKALPLPNYVYFDLNSTDLSASSQTQKVVSENMLSILGDRMVNEPSSTITLTGSLEQDPKDGRQLAESVKLFLVGIYGIDASRILTKGSKKLAIQASRSGTKLPLALIRDGNREVLIESTSQSLQVEFRGEPDAMPKSLPTYIVREAPIDSYVTFTTEGVDESFTSWIVNVSDEHGKIQNFGPYANESVSIPVKTILGTRPEGNYDISVIGQLKSGNTVRKDTTAHLVLWTPPATERIMRFSIIYEFNNSKAIDIFNQYLTNIVTPKIPKDGIVIIHGHSDIANNDDYNLKLYLARANDAKNIIQNTLGEGGRKDVIFEVHGFGEDQNVAPFGNKKPEEQFYIRTIIIDIYSKE